MGPRESVESFRGKVAASSDLQAQVRALVEKKNLAGVVQLGSQLGVEFSESELTDVISNTELSDFELEMVSGGVPINCGAGGTYS